MAKIRRNEKREMPALNTSSLPDIIFMLLFFFMSVTSMKEVTYKVDLAAEKMPKLTELTKLEKKSLVRYIYVGKPRPEYTKAFGSDTRIQLDDQFAEVGEICNYIITERAAMESAAEKNPTLKGQSAKLQVSIKADKETHMGIITEIKQQLRKASALKISYAATQRNEL